MNIVRCDNLTKFFPHGAVRALDGVSLEINKGETFGLIGESGSGKTTLGKIILGILKPDSGTVELLTDRPQVIFQNPYSSLDPKMRVRDIVAEGLIIQKNGQNRDRHLFSMFRQKKIGVCPYFRQVEESLDLVRLPETALDKYPHQFSGGERQRIAIARAVVTRPEFIVCDEPVSSLDAAVQMQILDLLKSIQKNFGITYLFISHDPKVIKYMCDRVAVMERGKLL